MTKKLSHILLVFLSVFLYGQVQLTAYVDKKELHVNERLNLTIVFELNGNDLLQESRVKLPDFSKFELIGTGSNQNSFVETGTNTVVNQIVYLVALEPKEAGNIKIGSALVKVNGQFYKSEPFEIIVKEAIAKKENKKDDIRLVLEVQDKEIFENQPATAVVRAYSKDVGKLMNIGAVNFAHQKNVKIKPLRLEHQDIEQSARAKSSRVLVTLNIVPETSGFVELKPVSALYNNGGAPIKVWSNRVRLNIKKLPAEAPVNFKKLVGKYNINFSQADPDARVQIGKPVPVVLKVSGRGNLDERKMPHLKSSKNYSFYSPQIKTESTNSEKSVISAQYLVIPNIPGEVRIEAENFSYFDPAVKKYINLGVPKVALTVLTPEQVSEDKSTMERVNEYSNTVLETVSTPVVATHKLKIKPKTGLKWQTIITNYSLIGGFFVILLVGAWFVRRYLSTQQKSMQPSGTVRETENDIRLKMAPDVEAYISFLKKLVEEKNYYEFFKNYDALDADAERYVKNNGAASLNQWLEQRNGMKTAEEYRELKQKMEIERYAPLHSSEALMPLADEIQRVYSAII